uniref:Ig-like domain-containing protein n=1 Tax=Phasianus colchicus TaxID=9054 RepID=A0A669P633_PHACC
MPACHTPYQQGRALALPKQHLRGHGRLLPTGCNGAQGQSNTMMARFVDRNMKHPQEGQRLELECLPYNKYISIHWIHLGKDGNLHFIVSSSPIPRNIFHGNKITSPKFEARWTGNFYRLVVKNFTTQDEGIYFCTSNVNQVLHFSSGQRAFFPVTTTAAALTTPAVTTQSSQVTKKDICVQTSDPGTSNKNMLNFYCEIYIWAPLAGVCLVLLIALIVTIVLCQSKSHPDTLQRFLQPHTTEHSPLLQGNALSACCPHTPIAHPGHRKCRRTSLKIIFHISLIYTFSFRNIYHILVPDNKLQREKCYCTQLH